MLSNRQVSQIIETELKKAIGSDENGEIKVDREEALNYFHGRAVGELAPPAIPNRSKVVSTDVEEVIEWILPVLLKTFTQTDEAVRFDPINAEDEPLAAQETDTCNYVFYKDNPGFLILYTWFKDALLLKNGYVKPYFDDDEKVTHEEYSNLNDAELQVLVSNPEVEVLEHTAVSGELEITHDLRLRRKESKGKVVVENCPPENVLVNADHKSVVLHNARFVAHEEILTASELREMGIPQKTIDKLPKHDQDWDDIDRNTTYEEDEEDYSADKSQRQYKVYDCYILMDYDEDGIAERRKILYVKGNHILENEEFDNVPFPSLTPIINPHRHVGRSIYDRIKEIAKQKTFVWRSLMDNLYFQTNARVGVNENKVNVSDMLMNQPGGVVRVNGVPAENIFPIVTPQASSSAYQMIEFLDDLRNGRTGIGPEAMGQNINISNDTAHGIERLMSAKEELVGLIARIFAETGVKDLFLQMHALLIKHQDKERTIELRGNYVPINPSEWRERTSMTVKVGLGTGDQLKKQGSMEQVTQDQMSIMQSGGMSVNEQNLYKAQIDKYKLAGIDARPYFTDPLSILPKPPQPDPQQQMLQLQAQIERDKTMVKMEELKLEQAKLLMAARNDQTKAMTTEQKNANDARLKEIQMLFNMDIEREKLEQEEERIAIDAYEAGMSNVRN
ncbi:MAG: hypothetical protein AB2792_19800 [Candidatus Thiodiazotropha sp.]